MDIMKMTALELGRRIKSKELSVLDAVNANLEAIYGKDKDFNAYITVCAEEARKRALEVQELIDSGILNGPLAGVPIAVKDNICTKDIRTTCASKTLEDFLPVYNATVTERIEAAGMIIIGKTNMDEFAMGSTSETSYFGPVKNPCNTKRVPGGSSGGSAAAVSGEEAFIALGSDTGGSIRQPASFTGIVGMKPTYGRVSRYGLIAYASSLDQIGPLSKDVSDCASLLNIICGHDDMDGTSADTEYTDFTKALVKDVKGMKIGIPQEYFSEGIDKDVKENVLAAAKKFEEMGAEVSYFSLPMTRYAIPSYYIIASAEASSNLSRYDGIKYGHRAASFDDLAGLYKKSRSESFGMEVKRRIMLGTFALSAGYYDAYYNKALQVKSLIKQAYDKVFETYDLILSPAAPTTALKLGENLSDPLKMYLGDIYTVSLNLAGLPGMVIPCGKDEDGMPVGLQIVSKAFDEEKIIRAAYSFEQEAE